MNVRLIHYKAAKGNVGDDFSAWMFSRLLSTPLNEKASSVLFGVGSILDRRFLQGTPERYSVFGSGARSRHDVPDTTVGDWRIYAVRGPLTARALGLPCDRAVCDPGVLAPTLYPVVPDPQAEIGIVPYYTASTDLWSAVARREGWKIVSPHLGVEDFITALCTCRKVFCESMHGAIFADAYGIPWRPLSATGQQNEGRTHAFKWTDWASSVGLGFDSLKLPGLTAGAGGLDRLKTRAKVAWVHRRLKEAVEEDAFLLSDRKLLHGHQARLQELARQLDEDLSHTP
jgi:succinoglycan biosynthesis protein ExoV